MAKKKGQKKNDVENTKQKTKDRKTQTPRKTRGEI